MLGIWLGIMTGHFEPFKKMKNMNFLFFPKVVYWPLGYYFLSSLIIVSLEIIFLKSQKRTVWFFMIEIILRYSVSQASGLMPLLASSQAVTRMVVTCHTGPRTTIMTEVVWLSIKRSEPNPIPTRKCGRCGIAKRLHELALPVNRF